MTGALQRLKAAAASDKVRNSVQVSDLRWLLARHQFHWTLAAGIPVAAVAGALIAGWAPW